MFYRRYGRYKGGRGELDVREVRLDRPQPLGGLPNPQHRHRDDLRAGVAEGGGEVADVVGDAVPLGIGPTRHHRDAHSASFPRDRSANPRPATV